MRKRRGLLGVAESAQALQSGLPQFVGTIGVR